MSKIKRLFYLFRHGQLVISIRIEVPAGMNKKAQNDKTPDTDVEGLAPARELGYCCYRQETTEPS